jgi:hypothetical protein
MPNCVSLAVGDGSSAHQEAEFHTGTVRSMSQPQKPDHEIDHLIPPFRPSRCAK